MKSIRKLKKASKIAAGSALLVGATLTGAAGLASASNHDTNLGDYPTPFVGEDGEVQSTIVVGESAATIDVVGAINVAGSLGQEAYSTTTQTVSGTGGSWSASNGVTLDTTNDDLFFADDVNNVRDTLTGSDLESLGDSTFRDDSGTEYDITQYVNIGSEQISFGNDPDQLDDEDPELHVTVPAESDVKQNRYLLNLQANIDEIDFTHEDVQGEDVELFGKSFTVSENDNSDGDSELVLYGSSEEVDISSGESSTVTINENEYTLEVVSVTGSGSSKEAAVRVDGELKSVGPSETINVDGQTIRIDEIIRTGGSDSAEGIVNFGIGSEELVFSHGNAIQDEDGDDIEGTYVQFNGGDGLDSNDLDNGVSSIDVYLGSEDDDEDALLAGESWSHSMFNDMEFHFGGLNPDARDDGEEISVETSDDETVRTSFTVGEDSQSVEFFNRDTSGNSNELADSDGDKIIAVEGEAVTEDEYFVSDAGDFSHVWEVNSVDRDETGTSLASDAEATVNLRDAVSDSEVEVELDPDGSDDDYIGTEIIDGQKYHFHLDADASNDGSANLYVAWGSGASADDAGVTTGTTTAFPTVETDSGSRVAFYDSSQDPSGLSIGASLVNFQNDEFFVDSSSQSKEGNNGYGDGDPIFRVINKDDSSLDTVATDNIAKFGTHAHFYDKDTTGDYTAGDEVFIDEDQDNVYSGGTGDTLIDTDGNQEVSNADDLTDFSTSDDVYATTTSGYTVGTDAIFKDYADNGYFDEEGILVSGTGASTDLSGTFDAQLDIDFDGIDSSAITLENSGSTTADQTSTIGLESDPSSAIEVGNLVTHSSTGTNYIVSSYSGSGQLTTAEIAGTLGDTGDNLKAGTLDEQTLSLNSDTNADTSSGPTINNDGTVTVDVGSDPGLTDGQVFVVSTDGSVDASDTVLIATGASDSTSVSAVGQAGVTISSGANLLSVSTTGSGDSADIDDEYLNEATDIVSAINDKITDGTASFNSAPYDGSDQYTIESLTTTDGDTSEVEIGSSTISGTDVSSDLNLDSPAVNSKQDQALDGKTNLDQTTSYTELNGDQIKYHDDSGDTNFQVGEDVVDDTAGSGTFSSGSDTIINRGNDGTIDVVDDGSNGGNDLNEDKFFAIDVDGSTTINSGDEIAMEVEGDLSDGDSVSAFATKTKHDGSQPYSISNTVVSDEDSSGDYTTGDVVLGAGNIQYWSSDSSETSGVSGLNSILPASNPGLVVIEEEADDDKQESYTVSASWDGTDEELSIDSPQFSDSNKRQTSGLESDDDITAGFDQYGVYSEYDSDEQGSFTLNIPYGQSTAGAAVTSTDGSLSAEGGSGSAEINTPTGFPDSAALDSDSNVEDLKESENLILVGGPAVNSLTAELADDNQTWSASDYTEGEGIVQVVNNAFTEGQDALVVAGYSGADTRAAANYIANYADNSDDLAGQSQVTVSTQ